MPEASFPSILNDVIGPIMRGPSSSHTAASWRIGRYAGLALGEAPRALDIVFEDQGAFADVFRAQRADLAFIAGALGVDIEDPAYDLAAQKAEAEGVSVSFSRAVLPGGFDHPNDLDITLAGEEQSVTLRATSLGGGTIQIKALGDLPVSSLADAYDVYAWLDPEDAIKAEARLKASSAEVMVATGESAAGLKLLQARFLTEPSDACLKALQASSACPLIKVPPLVLPKPGKPLYTDAASMSAFCRKHKISLAEAALHCEAALLGLPEKRVNELMQRRLGVMLGSVWAGFKREDGLRLLTPTARGIYEYSLSTNALASGAPLKAATRALAAMQENSAGGLVCAAPTAGSAGVMPGVLLTLHEDLGRNPETLLKALWTAGGVGQCFSALATFAAEVGGCQVEVGIAGAMAAAALAESAGGTPDEALDAAAMSLQNVMGLICDPVQGFVELPCHSRNAAAASAAFTVADMILGGWRNLVPFDETTRAVLAVGHMLPRELRSTALGGLAACPSACALCPGGCGAKHS